MAIWRSLTSWFSWFPWYRRKAREADLARELRDHLDLEADDQRAAGLSPEQSASAAHRALGNTLKIEEDVRAAWGFQWFERLAQDLATPWSAHAAQIPRLHRRRRTHSRPRHRRQCRSL